MIKPLSYVLLPTVLGKIRTGIFTDYILLIIDNGSYGSTGDQPTYAGKKTSLTAVAKACGCDNVVEVQDKDLGPVLQAAIDGKKQTEKLLEAKSTQKAQRLNQIYLPRLN
jgi:thiamine pyrophosphate-dependent acetolactate synthase large subunit-like protein